MEACLDHFVNYYASLYNIISVIYSLEMKLGTVYHLYTSTMSVLSLLKILYTCKGGSNNMLNVGVRVTALRRMNSHSCVNTCK